MRILPQILAYTVLIGGMAFSAAAADDVRHYSVGDFNIMAVTDAEGSADRKLLPDLGKYPEYEGVFANGPVPSVIQTFYFVDGEHKILVDSGFGQELKVKGNTLAALKANGIEPGSITDILLTHLDFDHIGGLIANGKAVYPNATVWIAQPEYDAWMENKVSARQDWAISLARDVVKVYGNRIRLFKFGEEILPGITAVDASGHTPGHTAYDIVSGNAKMTIAGDVMHVSQVQIEKPELSSIYDMDQKKAAQTRRQLMERAVRENSVFAGMHLPMISTVKQRPDGGFAMMQAR